MGSRMPDFDLRPLSLGEQLDRTFTIFRERLGALVITTVAVLFVPLMVMANNLKRFTDLAAAAKGGTRPEQMMPLVTQMMGKFALIGLLFLIAVVLLRGALAWISHKALLGDKVDAFGGLEKGAQFFLPILGLSLVEGVIYFLSAMVLYIPAVILLVGSMRGGAGAGGALGFLLAMLVIVGVMFYLVSGFFVTTAVLVVESDATVFKSLSRSWDLTKGHRWPILGGVLVIGVVSFLLQFGFSFVFGFAAAARGADAAPGPLVAAAFAVSGLLSLLITAYFYVFQMVTYYDLRIRKEGFDLEVTAERKAAAKA